MYTYTLTPISLKIAHTKFLESLPGIDCSLFIVKLILNGANFLFYFDLFILLIGNHCMCKYKPVEFQLKLEIERTKRRLRKEQKNSKEVALVDDFQNIENLNPRAEIQPVNSQESQNR